jgi:hypothetical protein
LSLHFDFIPVTLVTVTQAPSIETAATSVANESTKAAAIIEAPTTGLLSHWLRNISESVFGFSPARHIAQIILNESFRSAKNAPIEKLRNKLTRILS